MKVGGGSSGGGGSERGGDGGRRCGVVGCGARGEEDEGVPAGFTVSTAKTEAAAREQRLIMANELVNLRSRDAESLGRRG